MALTDKLALCTLADLKADLGITDASSDAQLERRILAASALLLAFVGRPMRKEAARVEKVAGFGTAYLLLDLHPVTSVASVTLDGGLVSPSAYSIVDDMLYSPSGWLDTALTVDVVGGAARVRGTEDKAFTVTYAGGYVFPNDTDQVGTPLPFEMTEACLRLASGMWSERGSNPAVQAESAGGASIQMSGGVAGRDAIPLAVRSMVSRFRRFA